MRFLQRLPLLVFFGGISLAIGFAVPVVFEWGQKPAARHRYPALELASITALVLTLAVCALVVWWPAPPLSPASSPRKLRFGLRSLFALTTLSAAVLAAARWLDASWASALVATVALGVLGWSCLQDAPLRSRTGALLASLFFPFVWMVAFNKPFGRTSGLLAVLPLGPAILPAELIRVFFGSQRIVSVDGMLPIAAVIVTGELLLGAWLAHRGGKLFVSYALLVLAVSSVSSLAMHAMYRM